MNTQPEALRLADALTVATGQTDAEDNVIHVARWFVEDAATELRLLHGRRVELLSVAAQALEALEYAEKNHGGDDCYSDVIEALRAAIKQETKA